MAELINEFETNGKEFCIVKMNASVSVMEKWEYKKLERQYRNYCKRHR